MLFVIRISLDLVFNHEIKKAKSPTFSYHCRCEQIGQHVHFNIENINAN